MIRKIKVCLVSPLPLPKGGISHWTEMISEYSKNSSVDIKNVDTAVRWRTVDDMSLWKRILGGGGQLIRDSGSLIKTLIQFKPDVIHLTTAGHLGLVRDVCLLMIARVFRCPTVYHIRFGRLSDISDKNTIEWKVFNLAFKLANKVISIDNKTEITLKQLSTNNKVLNIPNCFNPKTLPNEELHNQSILHVCFLGWVIPTKGAQELLNVWNKLDETNLYLHVIGPYDEEYKNKIVKNITCKNFTFYGSLEHVDAMNILSKSDVFVLPSYTEGFPNVVIEAMALGKAIVASSVGAIPDMLSNGCGELIAPMSEGELLEKLNLVISDRDLRRKLGHMAKLKADKDYSIESIFEKYIQVWNSCLKR